MRLLITGAAGFIGARVTEFALERGDIVVGVDNINDAYDVRLKQWRLGRLHGRDGFTFQRLDLTERPAIQALFESSERFDAVVHLAARAGVRPSVENPWLYLEVNTNATLHLLDSAVHHDIPKFVLASTSSLYGQDNPLPYAEDANTDRPLSPYAASKKAAEALAHCYHHLNGLDVTVLRYFTVYGPAGRPDMSLFRFVQWVAESRPVIIFGDGRQSRDFTYIDDIARGTLAALRPLGYEAINLGSDQPVVLADVLSLIEKLLDTKAVREHRPFHPADVKATWANIDKAQNLLQWKPETDWNDGVAALVDWYHTNREWASEIRTHD